jgi:pimeloyl-ACP methyl ester carboxylesterase
MKTAYRVLIASLFAVGALLLGACQREAPPVAGSVASADQVAIKYEVVGKGEPTLVFVHCWTCDRGDWDQQVAHFAKRHRVVRLDLAGHGESGRGRRDYTVEVFGADVAAVVGQLDLRRMVLIGHSMGGPVSVEAAKSLGERVVGVVGIDTFYTGFTAPTEEQKINEMLKPFEQNYAEAAGNFMRQFFAPGADPALVDAIAKRTAAADPKMAVAAMRSIIGWYGRNTPAALEALGPRLRNINGNPKGESKPLHPSVTLVTGAGHFIPQEKPAEFNQALEKIVAEFAKK